MNNKNNLTPATHYEVRQSSERSWMSWMLFPECSLNVPWMFTECSLNVHWMFPECRLFKGSPCCRFCCWVQVSGFGPLPPVHTALLCGRLPDNQKLRRSLVSRSRIQKRPPHDLSQQCLQSLQESRRYDLIHLAWALAKHFEYLVFWPIFRSLEISSSTPPPRFCIKTIATRTMEKLRIGSQSCTRGRGHRSIVLG
jgi:hypothetical protein